MGELTLYKEKAERKGSGIASGLKFIVAIILLLTICALTWRVGQFMSKSSTAASVSSAGNTVYTTIVIDAGHGGIDAGAVGADGTLEKNINLAVAERLYELCRLAGINCVMTRTEDRMLVDESMKSHRKMHDLKNRLAVVDDVASTGREAVLVSIHMNNFSSSKYSGLQVWYSPNRDGSAQLASYIQSYARTWLDPDNNRETKRAASSIYMLDRAEVPAVLVECGFLSNADECARLNTPEYQIELAVTVFAALCDWLTDAANP